MNHAWTLLMFFACLFLPLLGVTLIVCFIPRHYCPRIILGLLLVLNALAAGGLLAYSFGPPAYNEWGLLNDPTSPRVAACLLILSSLPVAMKCFRRPAR